LEKFLRQFPFRHWTATAILIQFQKQVYAPFWKIILLLRAPFALKTIHWIPMAFVLFINVPSPVTA
jgi:hypothetical protein